VKPEKFPSVVNLNFLIVSIAYIGFGLIGYLAYGQATASPITANLPHNVFSKIITSTLIVAIFCTYPIQMVPVCLRKYFFLIGFVGYSNC
jgi:proton-coupled amino acid transporter